MLMIGDLGAFPLFAIYVISCAGFYLLGVYHGVKEK
jgi:hypothetical protein